MSTSLVVNSTPPLRGRLRVPGDKSISHRALMLNAVATGPARITGLLQGEDVHATRWCLEALGVRFQELGKDLQVEGRSLRRHGGLLDCGNSGTTMRLLAGLMAGRGIGGVLSGDDSLLRRPMARVITPLGELGLHLEAHGERGRPPLVLPEVELSAAAPASLRLPLASAQVKSAVLLAAQGRGQELRLAVPACRDHTERLLVAMGSGLDLALEGGEQRLHLPAGAALEAVDVDVPGDISSAAFLLVAASIVPGSELVLEGVGLNPTRTGVLDVLWRMGADIVVLSQEEQGGELRGDLRVRAASLVGTEVGGDEIPRLIDELPVLALAAAVAHGTTTVRGAQELRVKETDRIAAIACMLQTLGVAVSEHEDGFEVEGRGGEPLEGGRLEGRGDHRIAMSSVVAGLVSRGPVQVDDTACIAVSYPAFADTLAKLGVVVGPGPG